MVSLQLLPFTGSTFDSEVFPSNNFSLQIFFQSRMTRPRRAAANSASEAIKTPEVKKEAKSPKKKVTKKKEEVAPEAKPEAAKEENPSSGPPKTKAEMKENGEAAPAAPSPSGEASEASASDPKAEPAAPAAKAKKPVKKTVPAWATLSKSQQELLSKKKSGVSSTTLGGPSARQILVEAVQATRNARGHASAVAVRKYVKKRCPHWPKVTLKTALRKAVEAKAIVQVKGSFKLGPKAAEKKAEPKKKPVRTGKVFQLVEGILHSLCHRLYVIVFYIWNGYKKFYEKYLSTML